MKNITKIVQLSLCMMIILISSCKSNAQTTEIVNGREFTVHKVIKGETVYSISRKYGVPQDTIFKYNKSAEKGIKFDQVLKFPSKSQKPISNNNNTSTNNSTTSSSNTIPVEVKHIRHTVMQGETLYAIAKMYGVSVDDIKNANSGMNPDLIKVDDIILIPKKNSGHSNVNHTDNPNTNNTSNSTNKLPVKDCDLVKNNKKELNVGLVLNFRGASSDTTKIATEFFYGFKTGLDSLAKGIKIKLHVFNTKRGNEDIASKYDTTKLRKMDVIIGPQYTSEFKRLALFCKEHQIPIVSPFMKSTSALENNPYVVKLTPSDDALAYRTIRYFMQEPDVNFVVIGSRSKNDSLMAVAYNKALIELVKDTTKFKYLPKGGTASNYFNGKKNVVFYCNSSEVTVKDFVTKFNKSNKRNESVVLVGNEEWLEFSVMEVDYYSNLNLHIPMATYANFSDSSDYTNFIIQYQKNYKMDPSLYSFKGYKAARDIISRLGTFGPQFCNCMDVNPKSFVHFDFKKTNDNNGWENHSIMMLRINEFDLEIIDY